MDWSPPYHWNVSMETVGPVLDILKFGGDPETGEKGAGHSH